MAYLTRRGFFIGLLAFGGLTARSHMSAAWADDGAPVLGSAPPLQTLSYPQTMELARAAFRRGEYAQALMELGQLELRISEDGGMSEDGGQTDDKSRNKTLSELLALSAEIMSGQIMLGLTDNENKSAVKARDTALRAVSLAPECPEANIQYALAMGFVARSSGAITAWRKKLPQQSLKAIEQAQAFAPNDVRVIGLRGAWHLEIIRRAGRRRAASMFDASLDEGIKSYNQALSLAPNDILITGNYGFTLLAINQDRYKSMVTQLFLKVQKAAPQSAIERAILERINAVLNVIDAPNKVEATLKEFMTR